MPNLILCMVVLLIFNGHKGLGSVIIYTQFHTSVQIYFKWKSTTLFIYLSIKEAFLVVLCLDCQSKKLKLTLKIEILVYWKILQNKSFEL